jgi:hypothetical protein
MSLGQRQLVQLDNTSVRGTFLSDPRVRRGVLANGMSRQQPLKVCSNSPEGGEIPPHQGGATVETRRRMAEVSVANLLAGLCGEALPNPVTR